MTHQKTINNKSHLRNLKNALLLGLLLGILFFLVGADRIALIVFGIGYLLMLLPTALIHINYFKIDNKKTLTIDESKKWIEICENNKIIKIYSHDIQYTSLITGLERKAANIWSGYFYLQIKLRNGEILYLTSLLLRLKEFPFKIAVKKHVAFPFTRNYDFNNEILMNEREHIEEEKNQIEEFYEKYADYSLDQLKEIVNNKDSYENTAVKAAEMLIDEKITVANTR